MKLELAESADRSYVGYERTYFRSLIFEHVRGRYLRLLDESGGQREATEEHMHLESLAYQ